MRRLAHYSADHPAAIALAGMVSALRTGGDILACLAERAEAAGVRPYSDYFDDAARLAGMQYCRALDLYVDQATKRRADRLGYHQAHLALCSA
ncbi:hypothetical protein XarbCFBP7408_10310 [Xanthomonas arboricola pv. guizotiae]|uniref:Uncharacterized protein n=1 Tax=Xanthomonas arboricola pv. guizotiae TaxID=487867 RepID=A0A2S7A4N7_9XANT|nr:hypothetical protein XarbCFBP7409_07125 [Xanthomonas arboricola pv. guizotiae]PPU23763.1 hypothetical protein XarbCFBP7408_10310 [Xanthomonas arboricola pv. guizotiae]